MGRTVLIHKDDTVPDAIRHDPPDSVLAILTCNERGFERVVL